MEILGDNQREGLGRKTASRVSLFLCLVISILLLLASLYAAEASVFRKARESVLDATAPILAIFAGPANMISQAFGSINEYINVVEENRALREENAELRQWMEEALALRELISVYEKLQSYQPSPDYIPIDAHVIGDSNDAFVKSMVINAGRDREIGIGMAVVNEAGLVGRVIEAGRAAARILLLTDVQSRIPVVIETSNEVINAAPGGPISLSDPAQVAELRRGVEGILVGRTNAMPVISFTDRISDVPIEVGQRVFTSGAGGVIPRGIPVGVVESVDEEFIIIDLYVDYARTRLIRVLRYAFPKIDAEDALQPTDEVPAGGVGSQSDETVDDARLIQASP